MNASEVQDLFLKAMRDDDSAAMTQGLELMLGIADSRGLSAEDEYQLRHPDYVMEMPSLESGSVAGMACEPCRRPSRRPRR